MINSFHIVVRLRGLLLSLPLFYTITSSIGDLLQRHKGLLMISKIVLSSVLTISLVFAPVYAIGDRTTDANAPAPLASARSSPASNSESESGSQSYSAMPSQADDIRELRASLARMEAANKQELSDNYGLRQFQYWCGGIATVSLVLLIIIQAASQIR